MWEGDAVPTWGETWGYGFASAIIRPGH
jgi:hypothetical protein